MYSYFFEGWATDIEGEVDLDIQNGIQDDLDLYAIFSKEAKEYEIIFKVLGETTKTEVLNYGQIPTPPEVSDDSGRPFDTWQPPIENVSGSIEYTAVFKKKVQYYSEGELIQSEYLSTGSELMPSPTPSKDSTAQYTYHFEGWTTDPDGEEVDSTALDPLLEDRTLYAIYSESLRSYTITWNIEGVETMEAYDYGETPTPPPVSDPDHFKEWDKEIETVTGDESYTAIYQQQVRFYNGTELLATHYVDRGNSVTYDGEIPSKESDSECQYIFEGWTTEEGEEAQENILENVSTDLDLYAVFISRDPYQITFCNYNGDVLQTVSVFEGETPVYTGPTPIHEAAILSQDQYIFEGNWSPTLKPATKNQKYYAVYTYPELWTFFETTTDTWGDILESCKDGIYTKYPLGTTKIVDYGSEGLSAQRLIGINVDELSDGSGYAKMTWSPLHTLATVSVWDENAPTSRPWEKVNSTDYLHSTVYQKMNTILESKIQADLKEAIVAVKKPCYAFETPNPTPTTIQANLKLWPLSSYELNFEELQNPLTPLESYGIIYQDFFGKKYLENRGYYYNFKMMSTNEPQSDERYAWTRSAVYDSNDNKIYTYKGGAAANYSDVYYDYALNNTYNSYSAGIAPSFCLN